MAKEPRLSIGVDARTLGATGIGRYLNELLVGMAPAHPKVQFHLFVRRDCADLFDSRLAQLPNISTYVTPARYYSLHEQLRYGSQLDAFKFDLIHFPNFNAPRQIKTLYVATIHDLTLLRYPGRVMWPGKRLLYQFVLDQTIRQARRLITHSSAAQQDILAYAAGRGIEDVAHKLTVVPLGVADHFWTPMKQSQVQAALTDAGVVNPYFLCVGAQLRHKNIHRVVAAFAVLRRQKEYAPYKLVIAGRRTDPAPDLDRALADYPEAAEHVLFIGAVTDVSLRALYRGAASLVFVSEMEGFGLPIIEAQACGTPVITSDTSSMPEVAGKGALIVSPTEVDEIARAMREVSANKKKADSLIRAGRLNAKKYEWTKTAAATFKVYLDAVNP